MSIKPFRNYAEAEAAAAIVRADEWTETRHAKEDKLLWRALASAALGESGYIKICQLALELVEECDERWYA